MIASRSAHAPCWYAARSRLGHAKDVQLVVGYAAAFADGDLGGADVHSPIQLHRVGVDDLSAQPLGQRDRKS